MKSGEVMRWGEVGCEMRGGERRGGAMRGGAMSAGEKRVGAMRGGGRWVSLAWTGEARKRSCST
jgi:hypothetical protein